MAKSKLIKDTTRAEREEIIKLALAGCGNGSCDNCGSCSLGAGDPYGIDQKETALDRRRPVRHLPALH